MSKSTELRSMSDSALLNHLKAVARWSKDLRLPAHLVPELDGLVKESVGEAERRGWAYPL